MTRDEYFREECAWDHRFDRDADDAEAAARGEHRACTTPGCYGGQFYRCPRCNGFNGRCACGCGDLICKCIDEGTVDEDGEWIGPGPDPLDE